MASRVNIGLDFGTTNCAVGRVYPDGRAPVLGPVPSLGAWVGGEAIFGEEAVEVLASERADALPIRDLKLLLDAEEYPRFGDAAVDPTDLAAGLLRHVKHLYYPRDEVGVAVIGTPVRVHRRHRGALRAAARKAGIQEVRFVYEPTAALIGAWDPRRAGSDLTLVIDWGGGTLDLAVIRVDGNRFLEQGIHGDVNDLGGSRIDQKITERVLAKRQNRKAAAALRRIDGGLRRFERAVEEKKIFLLRDVYGEEAEPEVIAPVWLQDEVELSPLDVFQVMREFASRAASRIVEVVHQAGIRLEEITHLLFAGGVCQSEVVRETVRAQLPWAEVLDTPDDPQLQTAAGCARLSDPRKHATVELAADLAVRQADNSACVLLPRGQSVALNSYRVADFLVTDPAAPEAVFDLGVCHHDPGQGPAYASTATHFQSLAQVYLPTGEPQLSTGRGVPDVVRMHVGVDDCLAVGLQLVSNRSGNREQVYLSGVPLAIRVTEQKR